MLGARITSIAFRNSSCERRLKKLCVIKVGDATGACVSIRARGLSFSVVVVGDASTAGIEDGLEDVTGEVLVLALRLAPRAELMRKKNTAVLNFFIGCQSHIHDQITRKPKREKTGILH
jgi:hypothetical protein